METWATMLEYVRPQRSHHLPNHVLSPKTVIFWGLFFVIHTKVPHWLATAFKLDLLYSLYLYFVYFILIPDRKFSKAQDLV